MGKPAGKTAPADAPSQPDGARLLFDAIAAFDQAITTDGILDLSLFVAGETTYRVPDVQGETRDYIVPNDLPFPVALAFISRRDRHIKAERGLQQVDEQDDAALREAVVAHEEAWARLMEALANILRIRQPDLAASDLDAHGQGAMRNFIGAVWLSLVGNRLRQTQGPANPKAPTNRAERRRSRRPVSSR